MPRRDSSELECFVLGLVWQIGPCSAYDIRSHMRLSPSTQWSASTGAIYPLMQRLARAGRLSVRSAASGKRRREVYRLTARGLATLQKWVGPPLGAAAVSVAHDPLRSRARFLACLPPARRRAWVKAAMEALDEVERRVAAWRAEFAGLEDAIGAAVTRSGEFDVATRRRWLHEIGRAVGE